MKEKITVLIADDHPIVRKGLVQVIEEEPGFSVVGEADDGATAWERLKRIQPQVAVLDINMPKLSGFEVARKLREEQLPISIVFLTMYKDKQMFEEALQLGAAGYVLKSSAPMDIIECIQTVSEGKSYISASLSSFLVERVKQADKPAVAQPNLSSLTPAELRILKLISESKSTKEIAAKLFISYRTVENHRANICGKLQLEGAYPLVKFALEHKSELAGIRIEG
jgi:DNA-binding NarL/FixJ family response regulator